MEVSGRKICATPGQEPLCVGPDQCGVGYAAERYVGRCESETLDFTSANCDEGGSKPVEMVIGPDQIDSPCVDVYQSNAMMYEGHYLSFPTFYEHTALPPAWGQFDKGTDAWAEGDGFADARMMHSRDGRAFKYVAGDRTPFFGRGPSFEPPAPSHVDTPNATNSQSWRESMAVVVKGYVVRNGRILMYGAGCRCRHNQDDSNSGYGGGEQITRLSLRLDGFASISASSSAGAFGRFTTKTFVLSQNHSRLFLNADLSDGGEIAVGLSECTGASCTPVGGYSQQQCVVQAGNTIYSRPTEWTGIGSDLSGFRGRTLQLSFRMKQPAQLYGFRFKSDDLVTVDRTVLEGMQWRLCAVATSTSSNWQ